MAINVKQIDEVIVRNIYLFYFQQAELISNVALVT